eukprot:TRINITY_DN8623_c0_g1_i1.p1 TRINITY_DN8623_c0_g1~~TRINITY_DN8623_c0_g1_i1.p1  ORF type:complete len:157 (-),score=10.61 TRINITY_DN8623_c0_g1_i1:296-766(-)
MEDACSKALAPVCRPMWWLDPDDPETFPIDDQFAIGDDIIVAPVVVKGQKKRDIYLPRGKWCELLNPTKTFEGPCWLEQVDTPLHIIPVYCRVVPTEVCANDNSTAASNLSMVPVPIPVSVSAGVMPLQGGDGGMLIAQSESLDDGEGSVPETVNC